MTFTKERIIEELKASTQNASGMFEINEDTICALMETLESRADAEPYGYVHKAAYEQCGTSGLSNDHEGLSESPDHIPLYTRPQPAPVNYERLQESSYKAGLTAGWNFGIEGNNEGFNRALAAHEYSASMLKHPSNNAPVSQPYTLPEGYLQGYKDGCEWSALMAEANHPQTGDWLYDDPLELAKAIRKGPDMLPTASDFREIPNSSTNNCRENADSSTNGWIPCSERMPEDEQEVITRNRMGHHFVSFFDEHSGLFFDNVDVVAACCIEHILVTHWMPLPAAPQQEAQEVKK